MKPTPESVLTPLQIRALSEFAKQPDSNQFYLSGASALAGFYLGHRRSGDLDLFTSEQPLIRPVAGQFWTSLQNRGLQVQIVRTFESMAEAVLSSGQEQTRVQLVHESPFRLEPLSLQYEGVAIDALPDLAANKLLALFGRAEPRDFVDVYLLTERGFFETSRLIEMAKKKDPGLDAYYLAVAFQKASELPDDAAKLPVELLTPLDMKSLKAFFESQALQLLRQGLSSSES